jgi:hypothetical protein
VDHHIIRDAIEELVDWQMDRQQLEEAECARDSFMRRAGCILGWARA